MSRPTVPCAVCNRPTHSRGAACCKAPICPTKACHLAHRANHPATYPPYATLPPTCRVQRIQMAAAYDAAKDAQHAALAALQTAKDALTIADDPCMRKMAEAAYASAKRWLLDVNATLLAALTAHSKAVAEANRT